MSGAILAQALLDGSTVLRFVQTSAVLSGLVPYGLFFLIAVAYAVGAARIAGRGALVQQVNAVEAISRVDVVCTVEELDRRARPLADEGLRVLLLATAIQGLRDDEDRPELPALRAVALVALADELRDGVKDVLAGLADEHVAVKVISGDDPDTVAALARRAGLDGPAIAGPDLARLAELGDEPGRDFDEAVDAHAVFGRIAPEQKEQIVDSLRRGGHQVAMVGDGVNDARALKRAHVGVAMRSGSSVTRDVADIVLLDDSFTTLPPARIEGRRIIAGVGTSMYLFLARVVTQMLVILTVTLLGLGFPYTPTQVGLTLFTVGVPTFFLTLWARPETPDDDLLVSLARFVLPVSILTAGFATAVYAYLYRQITIGFTKANFPGAITLFEQYTGISSSDPTFITASATLGAQSGLSVFVSTTAIVLILLLEPPHRIFTAWTGVSPDRRPTWLALALFLAFAVVLVIPTTRTYFGLTAPDPPVVQIPAVALVLWFVTLSLALRYRVMERVVGLQPGPTTATPPALTPTEHNRAQARAPRTDQLRDREGQAP
jgi:cation-transporting P-type ATPase E